ncbi:hypothetical protein FO519_003635 [Halicephalobus sp. NKZ332]|nr:hypothetical protein FO519_003635 [Halicephalobus sp. NKZ332]
MSEDGPSFSVSVNDIKARFESSQNSSRSINHNNGTGVVAQRKGRFEKNKNCNVYSSSRFRKPPPLPPKPKDANQKYCTKPPPIPQHSNSFLPNGIVPKAPLSAPPIPSSSFHFTNGHPEVNSNGPNSLFSPISTSSVEGESARESVTSCDVPPPTPIENGADCSSAEESDDDSSTDDKEYNSLDPSDQGESPLYLGKTNTLHTSVINQMKRDGLFAKLGETKRPLPQLPDRSSKFEVTKIEEHADEGPSDEETEPDVNLRPPVVPPHRDPLSETTDKYADADPARRSALITLEKLVVEICQKEEYFIKVLSFMVRKYPEYLKECDRKSTKNSYEKWAPVVNTMIIHLKPILEAHESLFEIIKEICLNWDSRRPNLAKGMLGLVDFLKICVNFLTKKNELSGQYKQLLDTNSDFAHATQQFEKQVLNCPNIHDSEFKDLSYVPAPISANFNNSEYGVTFMQQLDMVHQNIVRYTLFMNRYKEHISPDTDEARSTDLVLEKLAKIVKAIDEQIGEKESIGNLLRLQESLDKKFNVLKPGRKLLKEGSVWRQTRKELSERKLLLFTDALLLCHPDLDTLHKIELHNMEIKVPENVEQECCFFIYSPQKSTAIYCEKKEVRDAWVNQLRDAQKHAVDVIHRLSSGTESVSSQSDEKKDHFSALWITDDDATMCMMQECSKHFNLIIRRHHCRKCGYVICNGCSGKAPIRTSKFESDRVCSSCYDEIQNEYAMGNLFPSSMMLWSTENPPLPPYPINSSEPRILLKSGKTVKIKDMFTPPRNGFRTKVPNLDESDRVWVSGSINYQGCIRYGRLLSDMRLYIYGARYDPKCMQAINVAGYSYTTSNMKEGKTNFKLTHHTGQKLNVVEFSVPDKTAEA